MKRLLSELQKFGKTKPSFNISVLYSLTFIALIASIKFDLGFLNFT
jgi:hypothetical protein